MAAPFRTDLQTSRFFARLRGELEDETARLNAASEVAERKRTMGIGTGKMAGDIVGGIKDAVARAMTDARTQIGAATDELVSEIRTGAQTVRRAIQAEAANVRKEFAEIVGNAADAAGEAVDEAKKAAGQG